MPETAQKSKPSAIVGFDLDGVLLERGHHDVPIEMPGARETLRWLASHGVPCFVASNNPDAHRKFATIFGSEFKDIPVYNPQNEKERKPAPDLLNKGYEHFEKQHAGATRVFVGDREDDMGAAHAAKATALYFQKDPTSQAPPKDSTLIIGHEALREAFGPLVAPSSTPAAGKPADGLQALLKRTQGKQTFDELYKKAPAAQLRLVQQTILAALQTFPETKDRAPALMKVVEQRANYQANAPDDSPDKRLALAFNDLARELKLDARIIANGPKNRERAQAKQKLLGRKDNEILDLIRVKICSRQGPAILLSIRNKLKENHDHFERDIYLKPSGVLSSDFRMAFDGIVAQVNIGEQDQVNRADRISHLIYEARRDYDTYTQTHNSALHDSVLQRYNLWAKMTAELMAPDSLEQLAKHKTIGGYIAHLNSGLPNRDSMNISQRLGSPVTLVFISNFLRRTSAQTGYQPPPVLSTSASDEQLKKGLDNLFTLHQLIHVGYIAQAEKPWRQEYVTAAERANAKAGTEIMPERFLQLIPDVERGAGAGAGKGRNA